MASDTRRPISGKPRCLYTAKYAIVCIWVLLLLSPAVVRAQSNSNPPQSNQIPPANFTPSMAVIIVILIAALFLMGFFSIYIRHCSDANGGSNIRGLGGIGASLRLRGATSRGLDAEVIETFPTFVYSAVKGLKIGKGALECAVCLNEFEDDETLRLMPKCDHVFHSECIDAWLCSHVTCPVCRANLVPQPGETLQVPDLDPQDTGDREETEIPHNNDVSIPVGGEHEENALNPKVLDRHKSLLQNRPPRSGSLRGTRFGNFPRSHSTGHSLVNPGENTDRFTLRLPEDVRKQMITRALDRTTSCMVVLPGEGSSRRGFRPGLGGSSRGQNSFKRLDRGLKSDRWGFSLFSRSTSSARYPKVTGDGSTSSKGMKTSVKVPSFRRMEPKGDDEPGLLSPNSAGLPV